jgi:hypothetical protein
MCFSIQFLVMSRCQNAAMCLLYPSQCTEAVGSSHLLDLILSNFSDLDAEKKSYKISKKLNALVIEIVCMIFTFTKSFLMIL